MAIQPVLKFAAFTLATVGLTVLLTVPYQTASLGQVDRSWLSVVSLGAQSAQAQPVRPPELGQQVYDLMPDLPLENSYVNQVSGEVDVNNTLASRLIRYHLYVKGRPPVYRLDWKLTLADYLGVNDRILAAIYPGWDTLQTNPLDGDIAAIDSLTRSQREQLVQALVSVFSPTDAAPANSSTPDPRSAPEAPPVPAYPQPGDAQLLMP
ncbi:hypothetical protein IQ268_27880 [Oculatella sp. LEGE 06141]|uniref:hypothetical protein n=1 Tax=Oculatella sp. LEGE 06141 TaxID=1828648 RepID=UPI00187DE946|nr:hypothetical protein [Oculatella sp. LEGE 06141]MBE9182372.1 hypothetical protein [Oculatella sp. LEGE 06141]